MGRRDRGAVRRAGQHVNPVSGQYEDEETGLSYNRWRYYDREAGRFSSADPKGILGGIHEWLALQIL